MAVLETVVLRAKHLIEPLTGRNLNLSVGFLAFSFFCEAHLTQALSTYPDTFENTYSRIPITRTILIVPCLFELSGFYSMRFQKYPGMWTRLESDGPRKRMKKVRNPTERLKFGPVKGSMRCLALGTTVSKTATGEGL